MTDFLSTPIPLWIVLWAVGGVAFALALALRETSRTGRENVDLEQKVAMLHGATEHARQTFGRYARLHQAKGKDGEAKARANWHLQSDMAKALELTGYRPLGPLQQAFEDMRKRMDKVWSRVDG